MTINSTGVEGAELPVVRANKRLRSGSPTRSNEYPSCQVDYCKVNLTAAKEYHRRHKVCEAHSKAPETLVGKQKQRFCQQCSRFHLLSEFDEGKRSCRRRLAGHNLRRRKIQPEDALLSSYLPNRNSSINLLSIFAYLQGNSLNPAILNPPSSSPFDRDQLAEILRNSIREGDINLTQNSEHGNLASSSCPSTMDLLAVLSKDLVDNISGDGNGTQDRNNSRGVNSRLNLSLQLFNDNNSNNIQSKYVVRSQQCSESSTPSEHPPASSNSMWLLYMLLFKPLRLQEPEQGQRERKTSPQEKMGEGGEDKKEEVQAAPSVPVPDPAAATTSVPETVEEKAVVPHPAPEDKPDDSKALVVSEKIDEPKKEEKKKKHVDGSSHRDAALERVETEKRLSLVKAWEDNEKTKIENKSVKEIATICSWENTKKSDLEAKLKKVEEDLEKKKAVYAEKMKNKIATIHKEAAEKKTMVEAKRGEETVKIDESAAKYRISGLEPKKSCSCFGG